MMRQTVNQMLTYVKNPAYTGENRRPLLTGLSVGISVAIAVVVLTVTDSLLVAPCGVLGVAIMIYLRGYALPGTMEFIGAAQYMETIYRSSCNLSDGPLSDRHTHSRSIGTRSAHALSPGERKRILVVAGIIEPHDTDSRLAGRTATTQTVNDTAREQVDTEFRLTGSFRQDWLAYIQTFRGDTPQRTVQLASTTDADPAAVTTSERDDGSVIVSLEAKVIGQWASDEALSADIAAISTLTEWISDWENLDPQVRSELLSELKPILSNCPNCGCKSNHFTRNHSSDADIVLLTCNSCGPDSISSSRR